MSVRSTKMRKLVMVMLAAMLLASFLLATASFFGVKNAHAGPIEPLGCPSTECQWFPVGDCGDCYVYGVSGQQYAWYCRNCDYCGWIPPCGPWWFAGWYKCEAPC